MFVVSVWVIDMENRNKANLKKVLFVLLGIIFAILLSVPYIMCRKQIQQMMFVGYLSVVVACAISNSSILLLSSSTLIVVAAASSLNPALCVLMGGLGTAMGEQTSYFCGRIGRKGFDGNNGEEKKVLRWLKKHEALTVFVFAFLPLPIFDIVGMAAGALRMNWGKFLVAAVLGKTLKFFLAVIGVYRVLPAILPFIDGPGHIIIEKLLEQFEIIH